MRFPSGLRRDRKILIPFGKARLARKGPSRRSGSRLIGTVSSCFHCTRTCFPFNNFPVVSFGFYHFACIMLLTYRPGPKFAVYNAASLSDANVSHSRRTCFTIYLLVLQQKILEHARKICGACKCSPETVPLSITVCHTIFIWGPLVSNPTERDEIVQLLVDFENNHLWPTTWIINALKKEWGMN